MEPTRSSFPDSVQHTNRIGTFLRSRKSNSNRPRPWKPPALHPATLSIAIAIPLALILTLVLLLRRSQRDNGILFAPDINELPLSRTFMYQHFPTVMAVIFSIFWAWIDLEAKRLEPYYQLSQKDGALGKDSLLLTYPFGFVPLVPMRAFRQKHWSVFWASLALLLVTWGLVPTQAGIFSIEHINRTSSATFEVSTSSMPVAQQQDSLKLGFAQSAYGILSLNETLPEFMTRNYTLAPFRLSPSERNESEDAKTEEWSASTILYSLDLSCEPAIPSRTDWNNSGCATSGTMIGNKTTSTEWDRYSGPLSIIKPFSALYVGFWNKYGNADYYLSTNCPDIKNHTFFAAFTRNKEKESDPAQNVTAIFCEPTYYSQEVYATVNKNSRRPLRFVSTGPKQPFSEPHTIFNTTWLEMLLNGGVAFHRQRTDDLPNEKIPGFAEQLAKTNLSWVSDRQPLVGFSTLIHERPLESFLDREVLARSYEDSYRLLFARAMSDVLKSNFTTRREVKGARMIGTDAVVLEPIFTYIVISFLGAITFATIVLFYLSAKRTLNLRSDPSTTGSAMALVSNSKILLQNLADLDSCTPAELEKIIQGKRYQLVQHDDEINLIEDRTTAGPNIPGAASTVRQISTKSIDKPVRPVEFSLWMSTIIISIFIALASLLAAVFIKAQANGAYTKGNQAISVKQDYATNQLTRAGLPLPSQNRFLQNLLENYIPTVIATLIEPFWVLMNRLLCLLQPIQELQSCKAKAKDSVDLNYSSLPPQLVLFKALRARHFVLAAVCSMALLANVLSVAFAGLFHHDTVSVSTEVNFEQPLDFRFVSINGSIGPTGFNSGGQGLNLSGAYHGGDGRDQFYVLDSNLTGKTPLPPWTDEDSFYLPFNPLDSGNMSDDYQFESVTDKLGAKLDCKVIDPIDIHFGKGSPESMITTTVQMGNVEAECSSDPHKQISGSAFLDDNLNIVCQNGSTALEFIITLDAQGNSTTLAEKKVCQETVVLGWVRKAEGSCEANLTGLNIENSLFLQCQPTLVRGRASVRVDRQGRIVQPAHTMMPMRSLEGTESENMFEDGPSDLIAQSNLYIFQSNYVSWHNDTVASDFLNYFIRKIAKDDQFLDPKRSVPTWEHIQYPLRAAYASLFATWLGINHEQLLVPQSNADMRSAKGWRVENQERIFLSTALFSIALGILCIYALAAAIVYIRRPGEYLARLPTSLASIIALFAGSTAVQEMGGVSVLQKKARAKHFEKLDNRYGYGSYVGTDGRVHIGIEKAPFVRPWKKVNSSLDQS